MGSSFQVEPSQGNSNANATANFRPQGETVKRKRGRPRKYVPNGAVSLDLSPMLATTTSPGSIMPTPKKNRGRPHGSGRKQRLATLGQWMTESAGLAFAPHIITVEVGEDVASKILSFSQQRPRALCILSGNGIVSAVTLCQPATSGGNLTYKGRFEVLCLSGSYLLADDGGPHNRVGGINVALSSPGSPVIGGSVGMLVAATQVQVVVCSFVYGGPKTKNKTADGPMGGENSQGVSATPSGVPPNKRNIPTSTMSFWSGTRGVDLKTDIDLMRG